MSNYIDNKPSKDRRRVTRKRRHKSGHNLKFYGSVFILFAIILCSFIVFKHFNNNSQKAVTTINTNSLASSKNSEKTTSNVNKKDIKEEKTNSDKKEIDTKNTKDNKTNTKNGTSSKTMDNNNYSVFADQVFRKDGKKVAFLTFDDGPTKNITPRILDTLKHYNVKATFFVLGQLAEQNGDLLKREYEEGHSIGNHSHSHDYKNIYKSVPSFMQEFNTANKIIETSIGNGFKTELFRFPGGSFEKRKNPFKEKLKSEGLRYIDWNVSSGDAAGQNVPVQNILSNIKNTSAGKNHIVILMHDASTKKTTADALPQIIEYLKSQGYEFKTLK